MVNHRLKKITAALILMIFAGCDAQPDTTETSWPARPIKVIVPFGEGGGSDIFARQLIRAIESEGLLKQPMVVINVGGAGGTIGSRRVRDARPDGYTMLMLHEGIFTAHFAGRTAYSADAFEAVAGTGRMGMVVAVEINSLIKNLGQLMQESAAKPESLLFAANIGAPSHFGGLMLEKTTPGSVFRFVQYGGGADRFTAISGGHADVSVFSVEEYLRYRESGLRALAVFSSTRLAGIPNIPTANEQGFEVLNSAMHFWWMPKGTPTAICETMADVIGKAMLSSQMQKVMAESWTKPVMLRGQPLQDELNLRTKSIGSVSLRKITVLPDFPFWIGCIIAVLAAIVLLKKMRCAKAGLSSPAVFNRLSLISYFLLVAYVLVLAMNWTSYAMATAVFIFISGSLIAPRWKSVMLPLAAMALVTGFGLFYLFTKILVVDLPG